MQGIEYNLEPPEYVVRKVREIGGINPFGEPNFRVIWGYKRLAWQGGKFAKRDGSGNLTGWEVGERLTPKYIPANRWYFEAWIPNVGTREQWEELTVEWIDGVRVNTCGPYPERGEYEAVQVLQTPLRGGCATKGECYCGGCLQYVPLTPTVCEALVNAVKASRALPMQLKREARRIEEERRKNAVEQSVLDAANERRPVFDGPHVTVPNIIIPN